MYHNAVEQLEIYPTAKPTESPKEEPPDEADLRLGLSIIVLVGIVGLLLMRLGYFLLTHMVSQFSNEKLRAKLK